MAKLFASEMAERVTSEALQIHGGAGYTKLHRRRALLARRPADQDLRRHLRDPAAHHLRPPARQGQEMKVSALTGDNNYFEDFAVGEVLRHRRGKTIEPTENVVITNMVMNSASSHFDDLVMKDTIFKKRLQFGGVTASLIVGMASQDTSENSLAELGMTNIRFKVPVFHGDTLYAYTEVLAKTEVGRGDAGEVLFHHWGVNQDDKVVFEGDRRVLVKKRSHWGAR